MDEQAEGVGQTRPQQARVLHPAAEGAGRSALRHHPVQLDVVAGDGAAQPPVAEAQPEELNRRHSEPGSPRSR